MLKVGLTGSIAVGKSYVLGMLKELGCMTLDADRIAHQIMTRPSRAYDEILAEFGRGILGGSGEIDRTRLAAVVFSDSAKRARLNAIVHPRVMEQIDRCLAEFATKDPGGIAVVDAALIIEAGINHRFDRLIVVTCPRQEQIERLIERDHLSHGEAERKIAAQLSTEEKLKYADYSIDTTGTPEETMARVKGVFEQLRAIPQAASSDA